MYVLYTVKLIDEQLSNDSNGTLNYGYINSVRLYSCTKLRFYVHNL